MIPAGRLKRAAWPVPSAVPDTPKTPASVVTVPEASIFRITWFSVSATNRSPAAVTAMREGESKRTGSEGEPSKYPRPPAAPARAETVSAFPTMLLSPHPEVAKAIASKVRKRDRTGRVRAGQGAMRSLLGG